MNWQNNRKISTLPCRGTLTSQQGSENSKQAHPGRSGWIRKSQARVRKCKQIRRRETFLRSETFNSFFSSGAVVVFEMKCSTLLWNKKIFVGKYVEVSLFGCKMNCKTLAQKALEIFCKALDKMKALQNFLSVGWILTDVSLLLIDIYLYNRRLLRS